MKSPQAFRTISEVSNEVNIPAHVLRFWETKFPNINPLKRSGNRRYYRPEDVKLIIKIKTKTNIACLPNLQILLPYNFLLGKPRQYFELFSHSNDRLIF
mgnify:CR=1 FL=1